jgi:hypothetical protein
MSNVVRNVLAVLAGLVIGAIVNMVLVTISPMVVPPPAGVDVNNMESLKAGMHLFEPKHFIMPFLAHALGSLIGAAAAFVIAGSYKARFAYVVGAIFLLGGIAASVMLPAPAWYKVLDLVVAYIPMAWLGAQIGGRMTKGGAPVSQKREA